MRHKARNRKKEVPEREERVIKDKFKQERQAVINAKPIFPLNERQAEYFEELRDKELVVATGFAGTSKTFIPTCLAADAFRVGEAHTIILARPAVSGSQSLGFFSGDADEKMRKWVMPMLAVLYQRLGKTVVDLAIEEGNIQLQPLETIKGMSFGKGVWVIADEVEDCTIEEIKSITTRSGGCKMVLCGDIEQSALAEDSGLRFFVEIVKATPRLQERVGLIDFDDYEHIVRSGLCKDLIKAFHKSGY